MGNYPIQYMLADAGAIHDRIASPIVVKLKLNGHQVHMLGIRLNDNYLVILRNKVWI